MEYEATMYNDASIVGMLGGILIVWLLLVCVLSIFSLVCTWKVFAKAGIPGWKALVPFYNLYCLCKLTWGIGWLFLLVFTPILFDFFFLDCLYRSDGNSLSTGEKVWKRNRLCNWKCTFANCVYGNISLRSRRIRRLSRWIKKTDQSPNGLFFFMQQERDKR